MKRVIAVTALVLFSVSFLRAQDPPAAGRQGAAPAAGRQGGGRGPALPPIDPPKEWLSPNRP